MKRIYRMALYWLVLATALPGLAVALEVSGSDIFFLIGYQKFLDRAYPEAAESFYLSLKKQQSPSELNRALVYLSLTQLKIKNFKQSANNAVYAVPGELTSKELKILQHIKKNLGNEYKLALARKRKDEEKLKKLIITASPYAGQVSYSEQSTKESANFQGVIGSIGMSSWLLSGGYETFKLDFKDASDSFKQNQTTLGFAVSLNPGLTLHTRYVSIASDLDSQSGIGVYGLGFSHWSSTSAKVSLDYYKSIYPRYTLGRVSVDQASVNIEYWLHNTLATAFWLRIGDQAGLPSSRDINNDASFIENKIYNRLFSEVNFRLYRFSGGVGYWAGNETFGVRNDGYLVFSGLQENTGGANAYLGFAFDKQLSLSVLYSKENVTVSDIKSQSESVAAMLNYSHF